MTIHIDGPSGTKKFDCTQLPTLYFVGKVWLFQTDLCVVIIFRFFDPHELRFP